MSTRRCQWWGWSPNQGVVREEPKTTDTVYRHRRGPVVETAAPARGGA